MNKSNESAYIKKVESQCYESDPCQHHVEMVRNDGTIYKGLMYKDKILQLLLPSFLIKNIHNIKILNIFHYFKKPFNSILFKMFSIFIKHHLIV